MDGIAPMDLFPDLPALASSGYVFRITDNCGATADRYTVTFCDGDYLGLSGMPWHPQGVSQSGDDLDPNFQQERVENGEEVDLALGDLPPGVAEHVRMRVNEGFRDFMEALVALDPAVVAGSRDEAGVNEGIAGSAGDGIYRTPEGFRVRNDNDEAEDPGPFEDAREAMVATLPSDYSLCGPEFHPEIDVASLEPTPGVAELIAAREAALEAVPSGMAP